MELVRRLKGLSRGDLAEVGAKAAVLGELANAGFPVPAGFVITCPAYKEVLSSLTDRILARVTPEVIEDPAEIEQAAEEVRGWIVAESWPPGLREDFDHALAGMAPHPEKAFFAARTTLPTEALAAAFGAGAERAVLGLRGSERVRLGVAQCWTAPWTSRSLYYRHRKKIPQLDVALAVLVQPMLVADSAGVMFTQNPNGEREEIQIDSIWGLGTPLVQARVNPDRFIVTRPDCAMRSRQVASKTVRLITAAEGGLEQRAVEPDLVDAPSLTDAQVVRLAELGQRVEELFGEPQVIEWARCKENFYILQSRPQSTRAR